MSADHEDAALDRLDGPSFHPPTSATTPGSLYGKNIGRGRIPVVAHFRIPLNLPHAGTIAYRICYHLKRLEAPDEAFILAAEIVRILDPYRDQDDNPAPEEAKFVVAETSRLGRALVDEVERLKLGDDRLGQAVRNLFECLELGEEGVQISLRAGENPDSALRPT